MRDIFQIGRYNNPYTKESGYVAVSATDDKDETPLGHFFSETPQDLAHLVVLHTSSSAVEIRDMPESKLNGANLEKMCSSDKSKFWQVYPKVVKLPGF